MCIKKYVENYESSWKYVLDFYFKKVGGKFLFQCNFDNRRLPITLPIFYRECLQPWSSFTNYDKSSYEGLMNQIMMESLEHLLYFCKSSSVFWKELLWWIAADANIVLNVSLLDILFGKFDLEKNFL